MSQVLTVPKPRRNTELVLLIFALIAAIGAYALVDINLGIPLDSDFYVQALILTVLGLGMHIVLRIRAKYADPVILPIVIALNGMGLAMIHRLDIATGDNAGERQWLWTSVAVIVAIVVIWFLRDHKVLRRFTYISLAVSVLLLLLPLIPGISAGDVNGARVWIKLGPATFQPGEIAKITLAIFFAGYLSSNRDLILLAGKKIGRLQLPRARDLGPMIVAWLASVGVLVFQRDIGSSVLFFGLFITMIYVATSRISWVIIGVLLVAVGGLLAAKVFDHVALRIDSWLNAFDPEVYNRVPGGSAQIVQGLFGMASGGLFGTGLGQGKPQLVPFANSDMIIASFGEELGLIGLLAIVMLYLLLVTRGFRAALGTRDAFGKLLACGLSFAIGLQCFVVIGGVTRLIPLTGLTTPFLAAGGSSLLANWIIVALLLLISDAARRPISTTPLPDSPQPDSGTSKNQTISITKDPVEAVSTQ
ncbi:cell division protein FtsW (lipid II flippase) [Psychromicrobium silvestre]|uniref:Cell division protein FtsW (Lipid II flippase) n=1 Tax=Psychromicrobium silvestre TaxID=1645614 RepID=A0A7Y9LUK4_9MICC|nr:FtsW/RodA/SpoVE family cell cycle protein [Psychromicrobium silvestre]NYE95866.1 cell division protein FtsW (lipid II flippase) [Psychromicrobium silvestre]